MGNYFNYSGRGEWTELQKSEKQKRGDRDLRGSPNDTGGQRRQGHREGRREERWKGGIKRKKTLKHPGRTLSLIIFSLFCLYLWEFKWFIMCICVLNPGGRRSNDDILIWKQRDIQFAVVEEERNQKIVKLKKLNIKERKTLWCYDRWKVKRLRRGWIRILSWRERKLKKTELDRSE